MKRPGAHDVPQVDARSRVRRKRALVAALVANGSFLVVEIAGGVAFGSLALLADAAHMLSDVVALSIALVAFALVARPPSSRHTYGFGRTEVLAAQLNAVVLLAASVWIAIEAVRRFGAPGTIEGAGVTVVAAGGLAVNAGAAWLLGRVAGANLNLRAAFWHLVADALGSVGALVAGVAVLVAGATWVDPAASLFVTALIVVSAIRLLRDTSRVLLEATPSTVDVDTIERAMASSAGVESVHHTHIWSLGTESIALSAHVQLDSEPTLHEAQARGDELKELLATRFGIEHATLELECHDCDGRVHRVRSDGTDTNVAP